MTMTTAPDIMKNISSKLPTLLLVLVAPYVLGMWPFRDWLLQAVLPAGPAAERLLALVVLMWERDR